MEKEVAWLLQEKYQGKPTEQFYIDVARLERGEPLDYVIGFCEFLGCKIDLSKKPLIPRRETEFWVMWAIEDMGKLSPTFNGRKERGTRTLDIFSGSGCIGIAILKHIKDVHVTFVDNDKNSLDQIRINLKIHKVPQSRFKIINSSIFKNIKFQSSQELWSKFDYIFANPPYIPTSRKNKVQKSVLQYEPKKALFAGKDGLLYIRKFLAEAKNFLVTNGPPLPIRQRVNGVGASKIYIEFDYVQKKQIEKLLKKYKYKNWKIHKDQYGKWRWLDIYI